MLIEDADYRVKGEAPLKPRDTLLHPKWPTWSQLRVWFVGAFPAALITAALRLHALHQWPF